MKKIMAMMLGLSLIVGTTALFGQDTGKDTTKKSEKKGKKGKKKGSDKSTS
jgi:hypothetical protein